MALEFASRRSLEETPAFPEGDELTLVGARAKSVLDRVEVQIGAGSARYSSDAATLASAEALVLAAESAVAARDAPLAEDCVRRFFAESPPRDQVRVGLHARPRN